MEMFFEDDKYDAIWDKIFKEYHFHPSVELSEDEWLSLPEWNKKYRLNSFWSEGQESLVRRIIGDTVPQDMYALEYRSDGFVFSPKEHYPFELSFYDNTGYNNISFPPFYPNGDYYFFISVDWVYGLFGHPWRKELYVMGKELIGQFDLHMDELNITPKE